MRSRFTASTVWPQLNAQARSDSVCGKPITQKRATPFAEGAACPFCLWSDYPRFFGTRTPCASPEASAPSGIAYARARNTRARKQPHRTWAKQCQVSPASPQREGDTGILWNAGIAEPPTPVRCPCPRSSPLCGIAFASRKRPRPEPPNRATCPTPASSLLRLDGALAKPTMGSRVEPEPKQ